MLFFFLQLCIITFWILTSTCICKGNHKIVCIICNDIVSPDIFAYTRVPSSASRRPLKSSMPLTGKRNTLIEHVFVLVTEKLPHSLPYTKHFTAHAVKEGSLNVIILPKFLNWLPRAMMPNLLEISSPNTYGRQNTIVVAATVRTCILTQKKPFWLASSKFCKNLKKGKYLNVT